MKDGTAQGVAKVRHWESLFPSQQRLYYDPYAYAMFSGSTIQKLLGATFVDKLYRWMGMGGFSEMISIRTKWFDDQIEAAVSRKEESAKQFILLGAGYDTRGFRLDLWKNDANFAVIEVDQPEVQELKLKKLLWLSNRGDEDGNRVAERMGTTKVQFLSVDFKKDDLEQKLTSHEGFQSNVCSVVTMEGVTQYIPKESTSKTLKKLKRILAPGSTVLLTYIDQKCFGDISSLPKQYRRIQNLASKVGEPWVSGWTKDEFANFLKGIGYDVVSDTTQEDYNETYLRDAGRQLEPDDLLNMERFVVSKVL